MPSAWARRGEPMTTGRPSIEISPESPRYAPLRIFISVDLPAPFSPTSTCTSPRRRSKSTRSSATTPGNRLHTARMSRSEGPGSSTFAGDIILQVISPEKVLFLGRVLEWAAVDPPPRARTYDVLAVGRSSLDLYAHEVGVPITEVKSFDAYVGGCPTNVSVGTKRLGLRSVLLTAVGDDQVGDFILAFLDKEGVETQFIPRKAGRRTSAVVLTIQPPDRFPLTFYRDNCADRALTIDDVARAPVGDSRVVFLTGTGLSHEPARDATFAAAATARAAGVPLVVDIDYRADQWESAPAFAGQMQRLLRSATMAVGTEEEIAD